MSRENISEREDLKLKDSADIRTKRYKVCKNRFTLTIGIFLSFTVGKFWNTLPSHIAS